MAYVPIPKDLNKVKTKVAFNLTKRQLIGFSVAGGCREIDNLKIGSVWLILSHTLPKLFLKRKKDG